MPDLNNTPTLRFPEFTEKWQYKRLNELLAESKSRNSKLYFGKEHVLSVSGELGIVNQIEHLGRSYAGESVHNYHVVNNGDVVYTKSPLKSNPYGIIKFNRGKAGIVSTLYAVYKVKGENAFGPFIDCYFSLDSNLNRYLRPLVKKGAKNDMKINNAYVLNDKIFYPSIPEQKKIVEFIDCIDSKINFLKKKASLLAQYKKGIMQQIFEQNIRFKDETGGDYPEWEIKMASDIFRNHSNKKHDGTLPILAITQDKGAVLRNTIDIDIKSSQESINSYKIVEKGDFIISLRSFQGGIEYSDVMGICSPAYTILKPIVEISEDFFKHYFKKEDFISQLSNTVVGIRDGKQISFDAFAGMKIFFPSVPEQVKIGSFLSAIDAKMSVLTIQLQQAQQFKKGLLQQLFV